MTAQVLLVGKQAVAVLTNKAMTSSACGNHTAAKAVLVALACHDCRAQEGGPQSVVACYAAKSKCMHVADERRENLKKVRERGALCAFVCM